MRVAELMNGRPRSVFTHHSLSDAARVMWERDCGWVPVVDDAKRVVGVITDRDICMAAFTRGASLSSMAVEGTMSTDVHSVFADDRVDNALAHMRNYQIRRLPVVDAEGQLLGLLSLSDLTRHASHEGGPVSAKEMVATLAAVSEPRSAEPAV